MIQYTVSCLREHKITNSKDATTTEQLQRLSSLPLTAEQGLATVAEETVVPNLPSNHLHDTSVQNENDGHIYFKDLKLLAHGHGDNEEDFDQAEQDSEGISSQGTSPMGEDGTVRCALSNNSFIHSTYIHPCQCIYVLQLLLLKP